MVKGVLCDLLKCCWQYVSNCWSIALGSVIVIHWEGFAGSGIRSLVRPPELRGFMNCRCNWKQRRFSSARLRCMMSFLRFVSFVSWAVSMSAFKCSCRLEAAVRRISRNCRRMARRLAEMVFPLSGMNVSLLVIRVMAAE